VFAQYHALARGFFTVFSVKEATMYKETLCSFKASFPKCSIVATPPYCLFRIYCQIQLELLPFEKNSVATLFPLKTNISVKKGEFQFF
jgi:hypothetical protein